MVDTASRPHLPGIETDVWVLAEWDEYVALCDGASDQGGEFSGLEKARCYYDNGWMRIEMAALGPLHGRENAIVLKVIGLFTALKGIRVVELINTSFRKAGNRDAQPDIAFYLGDRFQLPPRNNQPVDIGVYGAPHLVIEIASTTLSDDLGRKRLLYERLGVQEYWVVNVATAEVMAFAVEQGGSREIRDSGVLPGLILNTVEEAMQRGKTEDDGAIARWLLELFRT
ncbi:Uma2 family endonuclease [Nodosilinea sp. LEGE 07088]|uniref:Uma2 family endonuclease n=1 Tax=Nodosilinea sp. LEGE 07088 TaxID=2777968 RepID=UPI0018816B64|nr:Uma2 family endonuclease [Nodosilinea sp. LEGE 07088]MBE9139751.1 Uma2 family endonuclease [Nodosilinea sp. LEGE 07088]